MTAFSLRPAMLALAPLLSRCRDAPPIPTRSPSRLRRSRSLPRLPNPWALGLWKVADEDTTIYLFGTIHALPETVEWYRGPIGEALAETQELVTEIPTGAAQDPAMQQMVMASAVLPADQSLRDLLGESDRATSKPRSPRWACRPPASTASSRGSQR